MRFDREDDETVEGDGGVAMARLIYGSNMSLDGYTEDERGALDWAPPDDDVFAFITRFMRSAGTYLYGRRMYETLAVWETDSTLAAQSDLMADYAGAWQVADKVVYSSTLAEPTTANTRLERHFDASAVHDLKVASSRDLLVGGPRTSQRRRSPPGWSTRWPCSSGQSSSVGATPHCRRARASILCSSRSTDSAVASSTSATGFGSDATPSRTRPRLPAVRCDAAVVRRESGVSDAEFVSVRIGHHGPRPVSFDRDASMLASTEVAESADFGQPIIRREV